MYVKNNEYVLILTNMFIYNLHPKFTQESTEFKEKPKTS